MFALGKPVWQKKTRLTSTEVRASATSNAWCSSGRGQKWRGFAHRVVVCDFSSWILWQSSAVAENGHITDPSHNHICQDFSVLLILQFQWHKGQASTLSNSPAKQGGSTRKAGGYFADIKWTPSLTIEVASRSGRTKPITKCGNEHCVWCILPRLLPTPTILLRFHLIVNDRVVSGVRRKWNCSVSSDSHFFVVVVAIVIMTIIVTVTVILVIVIAIVIVIKIDIIIIIVVAVIVIILIIQSNLPQLTAQNNLVGTIALQILKFSR